MEKTYAAQARACYRLACSMATHAEAAQAAVDLGWAEDARDFDAKVYEAEAEEAK